MTSNIYTISSNEILKEILLNFIDNNDIGGNEYMLDFFGTSISSWKRWKSGHQRVPHSAVNMILQRKEFREVKQELIDEMQEIKRERSRLRDFYDRVRGVIDFQL